MIGTKEIKMITDGKKLVERYKKNFSEFTCHEFIVRVTLVDFETDDSKIEEFIVKGKDWINDMLFKVDFGNYRIIRMEAYIPSQKELAEMKYNPKH